MVTKRVQIEFADPRVRALDYIQDIREAAANAAYNLKTRHHVELLVPMPTGENTVVVEILIPEEIAASFAIGNHLRGISAYLLSKNNKRFAAFLVGKRLLNYIELSDAPIHAPTGLTMVDRIEAIISFSKLLERTDEDAQERIRKVLEILKEKT